METRRRSYTESLIASSAQHVHKLKAKDTTGRWAYYFVLVQPHRERAFLKAIDSASGTIDLEAYGRVLASNYGEEASEESKALLREKYGFDV